jgi:hypothetical protein
MIRVNAKIVSIRQTYHPFILVNISATKNGWDKNLSVFLALDTSALSWLDNSSSPRIAITSSSSLYRYNACFMMLVM